MKRFVLFFLLFCSTFALTQRDNTFYVMQFPGSDVGTKATAAQKACNKNHAIQCVLVYDPTLAAYPVGSMPTKNAWEIWKDYTGKFGGESFGALSVGTTVRLKDGEVPVNAAIWLVGDGVTDNCAKWSQMLDAVPIGATIYVPKGKYKIGQTCNSGFGAVFTKRVDIRGAGSGWFDGTNVQDATVFLGTIQLATYPGSVSHLAVDCRSWTAACDGIAAGTGGVRVDDILYVGTYDTNPAHGVLVQADTNGTHNSISNIRAYNAWHAVAVRASHTTVTNVQAWDSNDIISKANAAEGDLYDVNWNNINCFSASTKGCQFVIEADSGVTAYNITATGLNFVNAPYGIVYSAQNGGGIRQVTISAVNSYNSGTTVLTQVVSSGAIGTLTIDGLNIFNATTANAINNAAGGVLSISNLHVDGTLTDAANVVYPHNGLSPVINPAQRVWDGNLNTADSVDVNTDDESSRWFRAPDGAGQFFHGRWYFSAVACQGAPGWQFQINATAQGRGFPAQSYVACIDKYGQIQTDSNGIFGGQVIAKSGIQAGTSGQQVIDADMKVFVRTAGATGKAACIKADKSLGYCSTQPTASGDCTCN